jgi:hypothetical protein
MPHENPPVHQYNKTVHQYQTMLQTRPDIADITIEFYFIVEQNTKLKVKRCFWMR